MTKERCHEGFLILGNDRMVEPLIERAKRGKRTLGVGKRLLNMLNFI